MTYKVHLVDLATGGVQKGVSVRVASHDKVADLKVKIASVIGLENSDCLRCVLERRGTQELIPLVEDETTLREISHLQGATRVSS